jgi:hypothetical protein
MPESPPSRVPSGPPVDPEGDLTLSYFDLCVLRALLIWPLLVWATVLFLLV